MHFVIIHIERHSGIKFIYLSLNAINTSIFDFFIDIFWVIICNLRNVEIILYLMSRFVLSNVICNMISETDWSSFLIV